MENNVEMMIYVVFLVDSTLLLSIVVVVVDRRMDSCRICLARFHIGEELNENLEFSNAEENFRVVCLVELCHR